MKKLLVYVGVFAGLSASVFAHSTLEIEWFKWPVLIVSWALIMLWSACLFEKSKGFFTVPIVHHAICSGFIYLISAQMYIAGFVITSVAFLMIRAAFDAKRAAYEVSES